MMSKPLIFILSMSCLVGMVSPGNGAQRRIGTELVDGQDVTVITSERLTFDYGKNYAVFEENVVVTDPGMQLIADKLAVWFNETGDAKLIKAEGDVHITQEDKAATAGQATYDVVNGKIVLVQNPRLQRGHHYLEGTTITYWRD